MYRIWHGEISCLFVTFKVRFEFKNLELQNKSQKFRNQNINLYVVLRITFQWEQSEPRMSVWVHSRLSNYCQWDFVKSFLPRGKWEICYLEYQLFFVFLEEQVGFAFLLGGIKATVFLWLYLSLWVYKNFIDLDSTG